MNVACVVFSSRMASQFSCYLPQPTPLTSTLILYIYQSIYMSAEDFLPLKPHWFHVLLSLADQDQHGYAIMQEVLDRTGGKVRLWPATLYGTLKRLIDADLIEQSPGRLAAGDERRRNYRLTRLGRRVLAAECQRLEDLVRAVHTKRGLTNREAQS